MSLIFKFAFVDRAHVSVSFHGTLYRWHEAFREVNVGYIGGIVQSRFHLERLCLSLPPFSVGEREARKVRICTHLHDPVSAYLLGLARRPERTKSRSISMQ